jgi:hypothetical protein
MPSGAQLNRWGNNGGIVLLNNVPATATAVASPLVNYGTVGLNDSGIYCTPVGMTKWTFQIVGPGSTAAGYSFSVYGTIDPVAYRAYTTAMGGVGGSFAGQPEPFLGNVPATSWGLLPMAATTGGGTETNPLVTGTNTIGFVSGALEAIRVVLTTAAAPTLPVSVIGFAVP